MLTVHHFHSNNEMIGTLGQGKLGVVHAARHSGTKELVAIKLSMPGDEPAAYEPWLLQLCAHPNVVRLIGVLFLTALHHSVDGEVHLHVAAVRWEMHDE